MIRRPPRSTRTDTLFPYTTLFRSAPGHILPEAGLPGALDHHDLETRPQQIAQAADVMRIAGADENVRGAQIKRVDRLFVDRAVHQIGRASCRERVCQYV